MNLTIITPHDSKLGVHALVRKYTTIIMVEEDNEILLIISQKF